MPNIGVAYLGFRSELLAPVRLLQLLRAERLGARLALGQRRLWDGRQGFNQNSVRIVHRSSSSTCKLTHP